MRCETAQGFTGGVGRPAVAVVENAMGTAPARATGVR